MIGPWPLPLQDQWKEDIMLLEAKSNTETSDLSRQLAEVTATFNSYKSRAQTGQRVHNMISCNSLSALASFEHYFLFLIESHKLSKNVHEMRGNYFSRFHDFL